MFKFTRARILPLFLQKRMTVSELSKKAEVNRRTTERAVQGLPVSSKVVDKIAGALEINAIDYLESPQSTVGTL